MENCESTIIWICVDNHDLPMRQIDNCIVQSRPEVCGRVSIVLSRDC